ncbi:MAG: recombinase family protein [Micrococcales bacterium]|nr:recombinase family protein [Micrococcales bacterium]
MAGVREALRLGDDLADEQILAAAAEWEHAERSTRIRAGMTTYVRKGRRLGTPISPEREAVYRHVIALRVSGLSLSKIAAAMNDAGVPTPRGGPWGVSPVQKILASDTARRLLGAAPP